MCATSTLSTSPVQFIPCSDLRLNQSAKKVSKNELKSEKIQDLIHEMIILAGYEADPSQTKKKSRLVGIAAPQVGVMKQIIIIDSVSRREKTPEFEILINPQIIWLSKERDSVPQGCFSVPKHFTGLVERSSSVVVKALDREGTLFINDTRAIRLTSFSMKSTTFMVFDSLKDFIMKQNSTYFLKAMLISHPTEKIGKIGLIMPL